MFRTNGETWKRYLRYCLDSYVDINDYPKLPQFNLNCCSCEFRENFASEKDWIHIIWNNKQIRIDNKPVYYSNYFESGITYVSDLLSHRNIKDSFTQISDKVNKQNS